MITNKMKLVLGGIAVFALVLISTFQASDKTMEDFLDLSSEEIGKLEKYDRPDLADLQNFEMTKDLSLGFPPSERLFQSLEYTKRMISQRRSVDAAEWEERGPNNFGGRTRAFMFDPNDAFSKKAWAAGVGGGLWFNEDVTLANSSWHSVDDFFGNIAISSIAYDPSDLNTFYFGTGEGWASSGSFIRGSGIWKSVDGGVNWEQLVSTMDDEQFHYIQKIAVTEEGSILAATRNSGGILRSTDGGNTWTQVVTESRGADIEIAGEIIYASTGVRNAGKIWKSVDDGVNWTDISPESGIQRIEIGVSPNHPNTVYAVAANGSAVGGFYRSDDAGENWKDITIPKYREQGGCAVSTTNDFTRGQAWYDLILAVDPLNSNTAIVGGIDLYKTTDGGSNWDLISYWTGECDVEVHADQHNFVFRPGYPDEAMATTDGGLYYTTNFSNPISEGGPHFVPKNHDYNVAQFYALAMSNVEGGDYFLAGAQDNGSHQFFNEGINSTNQITGGDGSWCFIDQNEPEIQITSFTYNAYNITVDFWQSNIRESVAGSVGRFINPADYNSNTNTMFATGNADEIIRYVIDKENVNADPERVSLNLQEETISALAVSKYDDDIVFVGTGSGGVFRLTDVNGSPAATLISTSDIPEGVFISSVSIGIDNDHLIATISNYGEESVFETTNGGTSWVSKEGNLPDMPVRWSLYNPSNYEEVLLATELGIWATSDFSSASPTWTPANAGLANVRCDMIRYRESDGLVAVATHGRGLYTSDVFSTKSIAKFSIQDISYADRSVSMKNHSIKGDSYLWNFGDGQTSTTENPEHIFTNGGLYDVTLQINGDPSLTLTKQIRVLSHLDVDYNLADGGDFESNTDHFYAKTVRGTGFELGSSSVTDKAGTNSGSNAWVTDLDADNYLPSSEAFLYTPSYDFTTSGEYKLEFYTKYRIEDEWEGFILEYTLDFGKTWIKLGDKLDADSWYNQSAHGSTSAFIPGEPLFSGDTNDEFLLKSLTLSTLSNQPSVGFRFVFRSDTGTEFAGLAIDDFTISGPAATAVALAFTSASESCVNSIISFENSSVGSVNEYNWNFGDGASPATAVGYGPHDVIYSTSGEKSIMLTASTDSESVNITQSLTVNNLPDEIDFDPISQEICSQESTTFQFENSQVGITYYLYDASLNAVEGDGVLSDGSVIEFTTKALSPGLAQYKILASNNGKCDRLLTTPISISVKSNPPVVIIKLTSSLLKTSPGDGYQWYRDDVVIEGATSIEYLATESGTYRVEVNFGDCISVSENLDILALSLEVDMISSIYPNPVVDVINLTFEKADDYLIEVFDMSGSKMVSVEYSKSSDIKIDLSGLSVGFYQLVVKSENGIAKRKLLKK